RGGVARASWAQRPVEHQSAAKKLTDEEIKEIAIAPTAAEEELGRAGGGSVIAQRRRIRADGGDFTFRVDVSPRIHCAWRRADLGFPVPQLERRRDAKACDPPLLWRTERIGQRRERIPDKIENLCGRRKRVGAVDALTNSAA